MRTSRHCSASALRGRRRHRVVPLAFTAAALLLCGRLYAQADTLSRNSALASALLPGAIEAYAMGFKTEAIELVDEALTYVPSHSDANYFRALYGLSAGEPLANAMKYLENALALSSFLKVSRDDARLLYASLLLRTRQAAPALRMLEGIQGGAETLYIESVARRTLGDEDGARKAILLSLERFPHDPRPLLAWLRAKQRPIKNTADAKVMEAGFLALETLKLSNPDILVELAPYSSTVDETRYMLREFRAAGGSNAHATLLALKFGLVTEVKAIHECFSGTYSIAQADIESLYRMLSSDASRAAFNSAFAEFYGVLLDDVDKDGLAETAISVQRGTYVSWTHDPNQDGLIDAELHFVSTLPSTLRARSGSTTLELRYDPWPKVVEAVFIDESGSRRYRIGPSRVSFPMVLLAPIGADRSRGPYRIELMAGGLPSERMFVTDAYTVERSRDSIVETVELHHGVPQRAWWYDTLGRTGHSVYSYGIPDPEMIDLDGDGRFEARKIWSINELGNVVPVYIETDLDADGLYEYRERLHSPFLKSWDYDEDGTVDLTLETVPGNKQRYRFFSMAGMDGVMDVMVSNGVIESVSEAGSVVPLVGDAGGKVVWVGRKPFDFGTTIPRPGYGVQDRIAYRVVLIGSTLYARIIQ